MYSITLQKDMRKSAAVTLHCPINESLWENMKNRDRAACQQQF